LRRDGIAGKISVAGKRRWEEAMALLGSANTEAYNFPFSTNKGLIAAGIAARVTELLTLDTVWTTSCARRNKPEDLKELGSVVDKMVSLLLHLSKDSKTLLTMLLDISEEQFEAALSRVPDRDSAEKLRVLAHPDGGVLSMIRKRLEKVDETFSSERANLRGEYERLCEGEKSDGDLRPLGECALGLIEMGIDGLLLADGAVRAAKNCT
jgi:hypothetical protein